MSQHGSGFTTCGMRCCLHSPSTLSSAQIEDVLWVSDRCSEQRIFSVRVQDERDEVSLGPLISGLGILFGMDWHTQLHKNRTSGHPRESCNHVRWQSFVVF